MKVIEFYEDENNFYLVSELYSGGELFQRVVQETSLNENEAAEIMKQIFSAVNYIHKHQIVHRLLYSTEFIKKML